MRLLTKYNRVNLLTTIIVMLITGIIYYQAISLILTNKIDKNLVVEENEALDYVKLNHRLPQVFPSDEQQITFTDTTPGSVTRQFINTVYRRQEDEDHPRKHKKKGCNDLEDGRGLITPITAGNKYYKMLIVESKVETEDLLQIIFGITAGVILLLLVTRS